MNKIVSYCQLAFRAGKIAYGSNLIPSIQDSSAKLVIFSSFCGNNRKKKLNDKCKFYAIPCMELDDTLFSTISNNPIQSFAILDIGFANKILEEMKG